LVMKILKPELVRIVEQASSNYRAFGNWIFAQ
jgi:hypothetical protein